MRPRVLILSSLYDFAVDIVVRELARWGIEYIRLNCEQFADLRLTFEPIEPRLKVSGLGLKVEISSDIHAVWFRAPIFLRHEPSALVSLSEKLARSQWSAFLRAMTVFDSARWMNHPLHTYQAECKPFQLKVAAGCGFLVPESLITNDAIAVQDRFKDLVAVKSIDTVYLRDGNDVLFAYTSILSSEELHDDNMHQAPVLAQRVLKDKLDLRVTVVGNAFWAYKITVNGNGIEGDWRRQKRTDLEYSETSLPPKVAERCLQLCHVLRLPFAAIDLIQTNDGTFFIEINPTGEWAWLPDAAETAGPAIATWLIGHSQSEAGS